MERLFKTTADRAWRYRRSLGDRNVAPAPVPVRGNHPASRARSRTDPVLFVRQAAIHEPLRSRVDEWNCSVKLTHVAPLRFWSSTTGGSPLFCLLTAQDEAGRGCDGDLLAILIGHLTLHIAHVLSPVDHSGLGS
jgi:hypothetical protein